MFPNQYDTYNDIDKSFNSSIGIILEYINEDDLTNLCQTEIEQNRFANEYSKIKQELFSYYGLLDFKFCTFKNKPLKLTNSKGEVSYQAPTNFIRFLKDDKKRNNLMILSKSNSEGMQSLYGEEFYYIGYIKDTNTEISIPQTFKEMVACQMLRSSVMFIDRINNPAYLLNINQRQTKALQVLKDSYL